MVEPIKSTALPPIGRQAVTARGRQQGDTAAMRAFRRQALERYDEGGAPPRSVHLWKYSDPLELLPAEAVGGDGSLPAVPGAEVAAGAGPGDGTRVVLRPGSAPLVVRAGDPDASRVEVLPLRWSARDDHRPGRLIGPDQGVMAAYNGALWNGGVRIRIPAGCRPAGPIRLVLGLAEADLVPRVLVQVEEGAEAALVEQWIGGPGPQRGVGVTEVEVGRDAVLAHLLLVGLGSEQAASLTGRTRIAAGGCYHQVAALAGGHRVKADLGAVLEGAGAASDLVALVLGAAGRRADLHGEHLHRAPDTSSDMDIRCAVRDRAQSAFTGMIRIDPGCPRSRAEQSNRNLVLTEDARVRAIPELEILTDDVVCSHGSTTAPPPEEERFYLCSRGIAPARAERLILEGFFADTLRRIPRSLVPALEPFLAAAMADLVPAEAQG